MSGCGSCHHRAIRGSETPSGKFRVVPLRHLSPETTKGEYYPPADHKSSSEYQDCTDGFHHATLQHRYPSDVFLIENFKSYDFVAYETALWQLCLARPCGNKKESPTFMLVQGYLE